MIVCVEFDLRLLHWFKCFMSDDDDLHMYVQLVAYGHNFEWARVSVYQ
ncbi:hypothetical protein UCMB321_2789 [Pseudomonas batumici]|uniref:Uncharacterized protein n=1 Tax=Pseudomonas batumici TaxID=226910 RepID=A0A0C2I928_9PSED|nr:hypothetical protein UCMB321_2789 [Pseudomonas batumici]